MLKKFVTSLDDVDEAFRGLYKETEGGFILETDDTGIIKKLDEFRTNNRMLFNQNKEMQAALEKVKDVDPEKYAEGLKALEIFAQSEEAKLLKDGKLDEVIERRTKTMKDDFDLQLAAKAKALEESQAVVNSHASKLQKLMVESGVTKTLASLGRVKEGALDDVYSRANQVWKVDEKGELVARDSDGKQIFGKDSNELTMAEWGKSLLDSAKHLFEPSQGGGGQGDFRSRKDGSGVLELDPNDQRGFEQNIEEIAKGAAGKVRVRA